MRGSDPVKRSGRLPWGSEVELKCTADKQSLHTRRPWGRRGYGMKQGRWDWSRETNGGWHWSCGDTAGREGWLSFFGNLVFILKQNKCWSVFPSWERGKVRRGRFLWLQHREREGKGRLGEWVRGSREDRGELVGCRAGSGEGPQTWKIFRSDVSKIWWWVLRGGGKRGHCQGWRRVSGFSIGGIVGRRESCGQAATDLCIPLEQRKEKRSQVQMPFICVPRPQ